MILEGFTLSYVKILISVFLFLLTVTPASAEFMLNANVSAYSSTASQTDARPWEMASNKPVYKGAIACPSFMPFGTLVYVLSKIYVCDDRLGPRMRKQDGIDDTWHFDIWMKTTKEASEFGRKMALVLVFMLPEEAIIAHGIPIPQPLLQSRHLTNWEMEGFLNPD